MKNNDFNKIPTHLAIILDGNGRWAQKRGLPRTFGHKAGADSLKSIIDESKNIGIKYLTVFAFSTENWNRPKSEIKYIMHKIKNLCKDSKYLMINNIKFQMIGSKEQLNKSLVKEINHLELTTKDNHKMVLSVAINYGTKSELEYAIKNIIKDVNNLKIKKEQIDYELIKKYFYTKQMPDVDFLIRTGGEYRLSNFMLLQCAYAELYFTKTLWPDFNKEELIKALNDYESRNRRYGGLTNI